MAEVRWGEAVTIWKPSSFPMPTCGHNHFGLETYLLPHPFWLLKFLSLTRSLLLGTIQIQFENSLFDNNQHKSWIKDPFFFFFFPKNRDWSFTITKQSFIWTWFDLTIQNVVIISLLLMFENMLNFVGLVVFLMGPSLKSNIGCLRPLAHMSYSLTSKETCKNFYLFFNKSNILL